MIEEWMDRNMSYDGTATQAPFRPRIIAQWDYDADVMPHKRIVQVKPLGDAQPADRYAFERIETDSLGGKGWVGVHGAGREEMIGNLLIGLYLGHVRLVRVEDAPASPLAADLPHGGA